VVPLRDVTSNRRADERPDRMEVRRTVKPWESHHVDRLSGQEPSVPSVERDATNPGCRRGPGGRTARHEGVEGPSGRSEGSLSSIDNSTCTRDRQLETVAGPGSPGWQESTAGPGSPGWLGSSSGPGSPGWQESTAGPGSPGWPESTAGPGSPGRLDEGLSAYSSRVRGNERKGWP
jgi:hypothetical protein